MAALDLATRPSSVTQPRASVATHALDLGSFETVERAHAMAPGSGNTRFLPRPQLLDRLDDLARDKIAATVLRREYLAHFGNARSNTYTLTFARKSAVRAGSGKEDPLPAELVEHAILRGILQKDRLKLGRSYLIPMRDAAVRPVPCRMEHGDPRQSMIVTLAQRERDLPCNRDRRDQRFTLGNAPQFQPPNVGPDAIAALNRTRGALRALEIPVDESQGYLSGNHWDLQEMKGPRQLAIEMNLSDDMPSIVPHRIADQSLQHARKLTSNDSRQKPDLLAAYLKHHSDIATLELSELFGLVTHTKDGNSNKLVRTAKNNLGDVSEYTGQESRQINVYQDVQANTVVNIEHILA